MNTIESVVIEGFWGDRTVELKFNEDVNFLIGRNGSGKTTLINLVAAALAADFQNLDRVAFDSITIRLSEVGGRKKPSVIVRKTDQHIPPFPGVTYYIKESAGAKAKEYSLDDFEEQFRYRQYRMSMAHELRKRHGNSILEQLSELVRVSWLSVHRYSGRQNREERSWESAVDRKLEVLSNAFVRFFSKLSDGATDLLVDFQKKVFLSLLSDQTDVQITSQVRRLDFDQERAALEDIYKQFDLNPSQYKKKTTRHFGLLNEGLEKLNDGTGMSLSHLGALTGTVRIHAVVEEWNKLISQRRELFEPKETFLKILNSMVLGKEFFINEKNELSVTGSSGEPFSLTQLSSGEKQLLIVLGEALLQERRPWVYIADEPELSLHVSWQESLVRNLIAINPNAQIIFATHSPDIVSTYGDSVFDMQDALL